jgi:MFS family permease
MRRLFAERDMRLLLVGQGLSMFGDSAMFLVLGIWTKSLTHSNAAAGLVFFVFALAGLGSPLTALVVDRVRRRPLLIVGNVLMAAVMLLLLLVHGRGDLWLIYAVTAVYGIVTTTLGSARGALLKVMVPDELLGEANSAFATVREGLRLVSPLAGAGLFAAFGGGTVAVLDAATFVAAAAALAALRVAEPPPTRYEQHLGREVLEGLRHIRRTLPLRQIVTGVGAALLVVGFAETLIFAVVDQGLHKPPAFLGVLEPFQGVGAIVGGLTAGRMMRRLGDGWIAGAGMALFAAGDLLFVFSSVAVVATGFAIAGAGIAWIVIGFVTAVQRRSPLAIQGRAMAAADVLISTPQTISIALGAALATVVDYRLLVVVMAAVTALSAAYLLTRRTFAPVIPAALASSTR